MKKISNSSFYSPFLNYFNEEKSLAYGSVNFSSEGLLDYYSELLTTFTNTPDKQEKSTESLGIELASKLSAILLDEEAIAELMRGDFFFEVSDFTEKEVTYTTYEYDADFKSKKVEKTKTELVPDFLVAFTTGEKDIYKKVLGMGLTEDIVTKNGNIYAIEKKLPKDIPFDIYVLFDKDAVIISTSSQRLEEISNGSYESYVSNETKKDLKKNSMYMKIKSERIVNQLPAEMLAQAMDLNTIHSLATDITLASGKLKGKQVTSELSWKMPSSKHNNSLAYIIHFIDSMVSPARQGY